MKYKYYSHRGYFDNTTIYENTLEAFQISIDKGYGIELDVRMTKDKQLIVFHDEDMKRMFGLDTVIQSLSLDEIYAMNLNYHIPTFQQALDLIKDQVDIIVEIKHGGDIHTLCQLVYNTLLTYDGTFSIESFHPGIVYWFKKHAPEVERGQLLMSIAEYDYFSLGLFMMSHLTSFFTKPHFYAYRKELGKTKLARLLLNAGNSYIVSWTLMEGDPLYLKASKIIFENCDEPELLWPIQKKL